MKKFLLFSFFTIFLSSFAQATSGTDCTGQPEHPNHVAKDVYETNFQKYQDQCIEMGAGNSPPENTYYCCKDEHNI